MKKQLLFIGMTLMLLFVGLSGCNEDNNSIKIEKNKFVGTWTNTTLGFTTTFTFFSDGTCHMIAGGNSNGTWDIKDGKLLLYIEITDKTTPYTYVFSNNDNTITMTFTGGTFVLTKQ